jgi:hypothetical protein
MTCAADPIGIPAVPGMQQCLAGVWPSRHFPDTRLRELLAVAQITSGFGVDEAAWRGHRLGTSRDARPIRLAVTTKPT